MGFAPIHFFKFKNKNNYILLYLVDDGGYGREEQNCIYRGRECSFEGTLPEAGDTTHVDMSNIFASEGAFKPLMEIKVPHI